VGIIDNVCPGQPDQPERLVEHLISRAWDARQSELWEVENRSRWRVVLRESPQADVDHQPDDLVLAPLERRVTNVHPRRLYPIRLLVRHQILGVHPCGTPRFGIAWKLAATLATALLTAYAAVSLVWGQGARRSSVASIVLGLAAIGYAVSTWGAWRSATKDRRLPDGGPGDPGEYRDSFASPPSASEAGLWFAERASFLAMLAITVVGPALALFYGTDLSSYLRFANQGVEVIVSADADRGTALHQVVGRCLQLIYCSVLSMLPALLYYMFDRQRLSSQRESWTRHLFHLNPHIWTVSEIEAAYGSRLDEALGGVGLRGRLIGGRRLPILVATIIITLGWTLLLLDTEVVGPTGERRPYLDLLAPTPTLAGMAFVGSYFFVLQFILRSFIRGDLRPKSYSTIAARVIAGVTVSYLVSVVAPAIKDNAVLLVVAFFAGYVPDTVLRRIANVARTFDPGIPHVLDANEHDLDAICGMDIYSKTKLISEGITNVETLAHTDPIDLIVRTRFPVSELIDWIDQAVLIAHLPPCPSAGANKSRNRRVTSGVGNRLASVGIRTATSLKQVCNEEVPPPGLVEIFGPGPTGALALGNVLDNLEQEPVLRNIMAWRQSARYGLGQEPPPFMACDGTVSEAALARSQLFVDRRALRLGRMRLRLRDRTVQQPAPTGRGR
jgi:hypothetical protein